jgi:23S rRNA (adenine2503-C2)-methyltransferase
MSLANLEIEALEQRLADWGYNPVHAARLLRGFYQGGDILDAAPRRLPMGLLEWIRREFASGTATLAARQVASDGTTKLLLRLADGRTVESVLMPDFRADRAAGCVSSQVGCAMGCDFCATTKTGFERNLTAGEIVEQFLALRREANAVGRKLQTIVFMGMGEPLLNLDAVLTAVRRLADNQLGTLGWRQITVSTVGIVPGIEALTATGLNFNLAVSLHAPDDATRARLLPMGKRFPIADILAAADRFQAQRGRERFTGPRAATGRTTRPAPDAREPAPLQSHGPQFAGHRLPVFGGRNGGGVCGGAAAMQGGGAFPPLARPGH